MKAVPTPSPGGEQQAMAAGHTIRAPGTRSAQAKHTTEQLRGDAPPRRLQGSSGEVSPHRSKVEGDEEQEDHDADDLPVPRPQFELTVLQQGKTQERY